MVAEKPSQPTSRDEFEIAIVCTWALEYDAVCLLLDDFWDTDGDAFGRARGDLNTYTTGCMGPYNIVVVLLCNSGKATAAGTAASLRSSYPCIELLLLAGICEGVPDANGEELLLGDVVISETVIQYDLGTQFANTFKRRDTLEDQHGRANKNIRNFTAIIKTELGYQRLEKKVALYLQQIQNRASETKHQRRRKVVTYMYPGSANDILFKSSHLHRHYNSLQCVCADCNSDEGFYAVCDESRDLECEQTGCDLSSLETRHRLREKNMLESGGDLKSAQIPSIFFGCFGSGDTIFSSGAHRDSVAKEHGIIAFEMEGAGVWDELPCIIVKGVRGYGDGHKTKHCAEWQNFAAATAASVARALVERYPQTDKPSVPELKTGNLSAKELKLQENKICLDALFITNPEDDKQRIEETKGGLLLDAYIWITRSEEYVKWLEDPETRLLWIKGDPGKGKTMLLCGIINELKPTTIGRRIYYFLCQATDVRLNNAAAILRGLLHMIVLRQPSLISYIKNEYDKSGKAAFEGTNSRVALSRIFEQMLEDDSLREPVFIIDALDECVEDLEQLLQMIARSSSSSSQAKWLVSSRNEADIQEALATAKKKSSVSLELNAESVSTSITTYIRHKVQLLSDKKGYKQPTRESIERYLSDNANGTFLWVALVCALLEKAPRSDPLPKSADFPPGLDQLYERMIKRVCASSISDIGRKVLAIAVLAHRPITKEEIVTLINNNGNHNEILQSSECDLEDILGYCGSFLTMRNGTIYFVHQSAKDFLIKEESQRLFPNGMEYVHKDIFEASISAMTNTLRKDMYGLVDPAFSIENLSQLTLNDDPLISIRYSCVYWIDHFEQSMSKSKADTHDDSKSQEVVHTFFKEKYIYWLEALSLLKNIFYGIAGMQRLERLIAKSETSGLLKLVWDARRFIQTFGNAIADYPLQVYVSALIFSPAQSITRHQFKNEIPIWIESLPSGDVEWDPSSRTYESSRRIYKLAVSCCGTWIASIYFDATVTIWETFSGKPIRVLDALSGPLRNRIDPHYGASITGISFSPWNRVELASICLVPLDHHQLRIWDITAGTTTRKFRVEGDVESISYLTSTHNMLGCISRSKFRGSEIIASTWDTITGQMIKKIRLQSLSYVGFDRPYMLSTFSPTDMNKIAWCENKISSNTHVKIYNVDTGSDIYILDYPSLFGGIKFSPDGSLLVVMHEHKIVLSDTESGGTKWLFHIEKDIQDSAFSADGKLLAIATYEEIHLFSIISGECLRKIIMRSRHIIFSPDGSNIFSTDGWVIDLVEMGQESFIAPSSLDNSLNKNDSDGSEISLSPDGKLVASISSRRRGIEIVDIGSNIFTHFLIHRYFYNIAQLTFSPDSEKLVIISASMIMLWDISAKLEKIMLAREFDYRFKFTEGKYASAFSPNSECFAITFDTDNILFENNDFRVQVWGIESGKSLMYLQKNNWLEEPQLRGLCFSPNSRRLAISHMDKDFALRIEIWDIASSSAIQAIELSWQYLLGHLQISNPEPGSWSSPKKGDEEDEDAPEGVNEVVKESKKIPMMLQYSNSEIYFIEKDHLVLDLSLNKKRGGQHTGIRVVLRTRMDLELTGVAIDMLRFKEKRISYLDSEGTWIKFNGKKLVWIPPKYRIGYRQRNRIARNWIALFQDRRSFAVIQFRHSELLKQISPQHLSIMGNMLCAPEIENLQELHNWIIVHRDINTPDNKMMHSLDLEETGDMRQTDDEMSQKIDGVGEIKDTSKLSVARRKGNEKYSRWKRKWFGSSRNA